MGGLAVEAAQTVAESVAAESVAESVAAESVAAESVSAESVAESVGSVESAVVAAAFSGLLLLLLAALLSHRLSRRQQAEQSQNQSHALPDRITERDQVTIANVWASLRYGTHHELVHLWSVGVFRWRSWRVVEVVERTDVVVDLVVLFLYTWNPRLRIMSEELSFFGTVPH